MKFINLIEVFLVIGVINYAKTQIYVVDIDVIDLTSNVPQKSGNQQRPATQQVVVQQQQRRTVQSQQTSQTRPVQQQQTQGTIIIQQQQQQPSTQPTKQKTKTNRQPQPQTQQTQRTQAQEQRQAQRVQHQTTQQKQPQRQHSTQKQQQQSSTQQTKQKTKTNRQPQAQAQQTQRTQAQEQRQAQRVQHQTTQQKQPQRQHSTQQQPQYQIQQTQPTQQHKNHPHHPDVVVTFPSSSQETNDVPVTFPGTPNRPLSTSIHQNSATFVKPSNPFLATTPTYTQGQPFVTNENIVPTVGVSGQGTAFSTSDTFNNGFNSNLGNGFSDATTVGTFDANSYNNFDNAAVASNINSNNFGGTVGGGNFVENGFQNNVVVPTGFNNVVGTNIQNQPNAFNVETSPNEVAPVSNTGYGFNNNGFRDRGENFDYNRWFSPHRPQVNHYRDFTGIFNAIDQKAETDYNTSDESEWMNDDFNGRSVVSPGQYPHMAALGYRASTGETKFKCGGSLISENFVLTAAHCCFLNGQAPHLVRIGDIKLTKFEHNHIPQRRGIARVIKHPYYNDSMHYNDIGLLELANPIEYTFFVRPIRLWARDDIPYEKLFTMGYGSTGFAQAPTNVLTELDLSIVPLDVCNRTMPADANAPYGIAESQICAKDYEKNRDTCQGDSGGPLQLNLERPRSRRLRYYLVGIISYGTFCRSQQPGVYTRVSSYIDWIASEVWPEYFNNFQ